MTIRSGTETQVNTYTTSYQTFPTTVGLDNGKWAVQWLSFGQVQNYDIYQQLFNADGTPDGVETRVNTYTSFGQTGQQAAALPNGKWVVVYTSSVLDGDAGGIFMQVFNADGTPDGSEIQVNSDGTDEQRIPEIAVLSNGGWAITWTEIFTDALEPGGANYNVEVRTFSPTGTPLANEMIASTTVLHTQNQQKIAALNGGGFVVTWSSSFQDGDSLGVYQQLFDASGNKVGSEVKVGTGDSRSEPEIIALANGGWLNVWHALGKDEAGTLGVYMQQYNSNGTTRGAEKLVNTHTANHQSDHQITALADGGWVVTWMSLNQAVSGEYDVYQQVYNADGTKQGGETHVNSTDTHITAAFTYVHVKVAALDDGGWVVVWQNNNTDTDGYSIHMQVYDSDGSRRGGQRQVNVEETGDQAAMSVSALENGDFVIAWQSKNQDGDDWGIFQRKFETVENLNLTGNSNANTLVGDWGQDVLNGRAGDDILRGMDGKDELIAGKGTDTLTGGKGGDTFTFNKRWDTNTIRDFENGKDLIDLSAFGYARKRDALAQFQEWGTANDNKVKFSDKGTVIKVKGVDLGDIGGSDIII
ncbi:MAG: calcium-binding protein [Hyphomicrobiaceae bacterium]|nr:calcium-binding protein [Hyphomicrobiaceae bacterium]MCC0023335.1 calcium-binding protein [Hyphomicrobiaceae bacterium]